jgi:carbamoyltransferase
MNILGVIYHPEFGHPAACLIQNGKLTAFVEEERLVRVKQAKGYFPSRSIAYCLKQGNINLKEVDYIAFGWDANYYKFRYPLFLGKSFLNNHILKKRNWGKKNVSIGRSGLGSAVISGFKDILNYQPKGVKQQIVFGLNEAGFVGEDVPPIIYIKHHLTHAASAFYCSGFDESAILVFDGHGEQNTITIFRGEKKEIKLLKEINIPHSLGWFYSAFTEYLGWDPNEGEVKLMGLAPFGFENPEIKKIIDDIVTITRNGVKINTDYLFYSNRSYGQFYSDLLVSKFGKPRKKGEELTQHHKDIAYAVQSKLEEAGVFLSKQALMLADSQNLCLVGGVALNCKMNGVIHKSGIAENIFVQPISYDAGVSIGAAMVVSMGKGDDCRYVMDHLYLGPDYSDDEIEKILIRNKTKYKFEENIPAAAAKMITKGKIVGWFQGKMEAGPRALGGRSILADPRDPGMKDKVNDYVKFRENWRPFALSIQEEYKEEYLEKPVDSPFMVMAFDVVEGKSEDIQSAMHWIDNTTRPQTVSKKTNPIYWELIEEFRKLTGVPGILNTSFNVKDEPIVCSPTDALRCFYSTGMDVLFIGNFVIVKDKGK